MNDTFRHNLPVDEPQDVRIHTYDQNTTGTTSHCQKKKTTNRNHIDAWEE